MIPHAPVDDRTEEWRPVPGWEGLYEISDHGRVRSLERTVVSKRGARRTFPSVIRKRQIDSRGRELVGLSRDGRQISLALPALVALAFLGPRPEGKQVAHGDGNPLNNHISNLRYATPSENAHDMRLHGTNAMLNRTHCPQGHPYAGDNIKWERKGHRKCRTCANARCREYAASGRRRAVRKPVETEALQIRRWAESQGIPVAKVGRLSPALREAYYTLTDRTAA